MNTRNIALSIVTLLFAFAFVGVVAAYPSVTVVDSRNQALYTPKQTVVVYGGVNNAYPYTTSYNGVNTYNGYDYVTGSTASRFYDRGYDDGYDDGYDEGYDDGYDDGRDDDRYDYRYDRYGTTSRRCNTYSYWYDPSCPDYKHTSTIYYRNGAITYSGTSPYGYGTTYGGYYPRTMVAYPEIGYYDSHSVYGY